MLDKRIIPETVPFDFEENLEAAKAKFESEGYDTQEGSNAMQLATAMAYLISMLNANTAVNVNEMLLPLARKRKMVLQGARLLGYEIKHATSYKYKLKLEFPSGTHQINKYTEFTSGDKTYYYMGESIPAFQGNTTIELEVKEGDLKRWSDEPSLITDILTTTLDENDPRVDYYVDIPFEKVEDEGLEVFVERMEEGGTLLSPVSYPKINNFLIDSDTITDPGFVRLDNIDFGTPRIYFKLGDVGLNLSNGSVIKVNALISSGTDGKAEGDFSTDLDCEIVDYVLTSNGSNEESNESIKRNAPLYYNSAHRLVTKNDYKSFIQRDSRIKSASVWDGSDEYPKRPGNIWYSGLPSHTIRAFDSNLTKTKWILQDSGSSGNWHLVETDVESILDSMKAIRIPTLTIHQRHPIYLDFDYEIEIVRYSRSLTPQEWNERVFNVINEYFINAPSSPGVEDYNYEYFQSNLDKRIDTHLTDSSGFNIRLKNSITLSTNDIIHEVIPIGNGSETLISNQFRFHLGTPFEKFQEPSMSGMVVITDVLPRLRTDIRGNDFTIEFGNALPMSSDGYRYDIKLGSVSVGEYRVFLNTADTIEIILNVGSGPSGITQSDVDAGIKIEIDYFTPNFKVNMNTIPRLNSVEFLTI